jgi:hypothetical protein
VRTVRDSQIQSVDRAQSFILLTQGVHIETLDFKRLIYTFNIFHAPSEQQKRKFCAEDHHQEVIQLSCRYAT